MVHCSWSSDVLLLWEKEHGHVIKPGYMKKMKTAEVAESKDTFIS